MNDIREDTDVDETSVVASAQVVQNRSLVQVSQVRHVLQLLKLRWIHLLNDVFLDRSLLFIDNML